jgi:hypothetical protein
MDATRLRHTRDRTWQLWNAEPLPYCDALHQAQPSPGLEAGSKGARSG